MCKGWVVESIYEFGDSAWVDHRVESDKAMIDIGGINIKIKCRDI